MKRLCIIFLTFLLVNPVFGQLTNTSYDEVIYTRLEAAELNGQIPIGDLSQKPLAIWKAQSLSDSLERDLQEFLQDELGYPTQSGWDVHWLENVSSNISVQNTPFRPIALNGIAESVQAVNQPIYFPFSNNRFQRSITSLETGHRLTNNKNFEVYVRPQFTLAMHPDEKSEVRLKNGWIRTKVGNIGLQLGRDEIMWHDSNSGNDFYGNRAPTFDMFRLTTLDAFRLPWFMSGLGKFKFSTLLAHQGKYQGVSRAIYSAWRIDYQFFKRWNFTVEHSMHLGGGQNAKPNIKDFIAEYVGFILSAGNPFPSDHNIAFALSYAGNNNRAYAFINIEDTDKQWKLLLWRNALWKWGFVKYGLGGSDNIFARIELVKSGPRVFKHHIYNRPELLQDDFLNLAFGPDAVSFTSEVGWWMNQKQNLLKAQGQFYFRSSDDWRILSENGDFKDVVRIADNTEEYHYILAAKYFAKLNEQLSFVGKAGLDFVRNSNFQSGRSDFNYLFSAELIYRPFQK